MRLSWFTDTLAKRLFLLMWAALVGSQLLAYAAVRLVHFEDKGGPLVIPTLPSLPPTPGLPDARMPRREGGGPPPGFERERAPDQGRDQGRDHDLNRERMPPSQARGEPGPSDDGPDLRPEMARAMGHDDGRQWPQRSFRGGLPTSALLMDYGIRLLVIALAAWWGSRWLAAPVKKLVDASDALAASIRSGPQAGGTPPPLDEQRGTREVREAARVFNSMASQLRRQFSQRALMVSAISHDLRTPLTRLRMRLETLGLDPEPLQRSVTDIREINALVDTVLEVFRGDSGAAEAPQANDIAALLQALCDDLAEQGLAVTFEGESLVREIQPQALRRVLGNLIGNALRYGGRADVKLQRNEGGGFTITIDDNGPGIPPAQLETVFEPFYRVEASRNRHTGGMGLGLYIARDLTLRMGGTLKLSNREAGGLRAEVALP